MKNNTRELQDVPITLDSVDSISTEFEWWKSTSLQNKVGRVSAYTMLVLMTAVFLFPFVWMLSTSLKPAAQVFVWPMEWIPSPIRWENYLIALSRRPFGLYAINSLIVSGGSVIGQVFAATVVGYSFARLKWPGRDLLFAVLLSTLMLPNSVMLLPRFIIFAELRWVNTFLPLIVPEFFGSAFSIFLVRQFMKTLPMSLDESARIDGCGYVGVLLRILLPLSKPVIVIVAINTFRFNWNDFLQPLVYLNDRTLWTLPIGLRAFEQAFTVEWNLLMAASITVMAPVVFLFFVAQRFFTQGIVFTGIK